MNNKIPRSFCTFETKTENIKFWSSAIGKKISANKRYTNEHTKCASTTVQLNFFVSKWSQMNLTVLQKPSIIKSRPFSQHQKCQVTIVCSKMIQSCDAWKSKRFRITHDKKYFIFNFASLQCFLSCYKHEWFTQRFISSFIQRYLRLPIFCCMFCGNF